MSSQTTVGTTKGILVSNRPESQLQISPHILLDIPFNQPFLPSGKAPINVAHLGLPPAKEERDYYAAKVQLAERNRELREHSVHAKHKQWLKSFGEQRQEQRMTILENEMEAKERRRRFLEMQSKLRKALTSCEAPGRLLLSNTNLKEACDENLYPHNTDSLTKTLSQAIKEHMVSHKVAKLDEDSSNTVISNEKRQPKITLNKKQKKKGSNKPKWAMKEDEAEDALDEEAEDLINFANSLNFEDIIDDFEVREALGVIQAKVEAKQKKEPPVEQQTRENGSVPDDTATSGDINHPSWETGSTINDRRNTNRSSSSSINHDKEWNASTKLDESSMDPSRSLLQVPAALRTIHSKASVNTILESVREKERDTAKINSLLKEIANLKETQARAHFIPTVVSHDQHHMGLPQVSKVLDESQKEENSRLLLKLKKDPNYVQNLPYLYRCPSI